METKQFLFQIAEKIMQEDSMNNIYRVIACVKEFYLQDAALAKDAEQHAIDTVKIVMRTLNKIK